MKVIDRYVSYIRDIRRYSPRTVEIYHEVLKRFVHVTFDGEDPSDEELVKSMSHNMIRNYEVALLDDAKMLPKTVRLHLSVLSGFCRYLIKEGLMNSNPVRLVPKPKQNKRLPHFYREGPMEDYFHKTEMYASREFLDSFIELGSGPTYEDLYKRRLSRLIISSLYSLGLRRSELIGLNVGSIDFSRKVVKVFGKGNKMREIPLVDSLSEEILLYLKAVEALVGGERSAKEPFFVTFANRRLYPAYVDKVVKTELGDVDGITGRKSPHVLRHSLATGLMNEGTDLNSIKELLGHSSLATTQVYTHSSFARLKNIYEHAHPRAKNGGKNGD